MGTFFLMCGCLLAPGLFVEKAIFPSLNSLCDFAKKNHSVPEKQKSGLFLSSLFINTSTPCQYHSLDYCSYIIS